jgi:hypothetical protein
MILGLSNPLAESKTLNFDDKLVDFFFILDFFIVFVY